ncbi:MAG: hypothetical protein Q8O14_09650 [bacterium]|nr:hypothetical protein [bacterium]
MTGRWRAAVILALAAVPAARAVLTGVLPAPGGSLSPGQNIQLTFAPPLGLVEFNELDRLIEIRDERSGRLYWTPAAVGNPPYSTVFLMPNEVVRPWNPGAIVRLEMAVDSSLGDPVSLQPAHFRWPLLCDDCEWIGQREPWALTLQGPASESLDLLPLDLDRDNLIDLALARRELLVFFGVDTCAANPVIHGLGGLGLDWALERRLSSLTLGRSGAGMIHPGEGLLLHTGGQAEGVRVLARTGADNSPVFTQQVLTDGSYAGSPKLARPIRMVPGHLCQDLLVATRGGDLVLFPARDDCAQIEADSARVLAGGMGDPLDLLIIQGTALAPGAFRDYVLLLEASPTPLRMLVWNGSTLTQAWSAPPDTLQGMERLEPWSDGDAAGWPDLIAWNGDGQVVVVSNIDVANQRAAVHAWTYPEPLRDVEALPDGRVVFAGWSSLTVAMDPRTGELQPLLAELPAAPRRLRAYDVNADGGHDLALLYQDGRLDILLDEPVGAARLELPTRLEWREVAAGDTLRETITLRHRGHAGTMVVDVSAPPAHPAFPFSWDDLPPAALQPGDSLAVELRVHPALPLDSCWSQAQFNAWWSFPDCPGQVGQAWTVLCLQAGLAAPVASVDSLDLGVDCGGHAQCEPECPAADFWLRNTGTAVLRLGQPMFEAHPDDSLSAPESFCLLEWPSAPIAVGDSARLRLSFCPPMTGPWPWRQGALLALPTNAPGADSLLMLPVLGLLSCPWAAEFTDDLPPMTEDIAAWLDLAPIIRDLDDEIATLQLTVHGVTGSGGLPADSLLTVTGQDGLRLHLRPGRDVNSQRFPQLGLDLELLDGSGNLTRDTLLCRILPVDDPPAWAARPDTLLTVREGRTLRLDFTWREVDGDPLARSFGLYRDAAHLQPVEELAFGGEGQWRYERPLAEGDSALFGGRLWWTCRLADLAGTQGYWIGAGGRLDLTSRRDTLRMTEDQELVLNLADWLLSPGEDAAGATSRLLGIFGSGDLPPAEALDVEDLGGLLYRVRPAPDLNRHRVPGLGLLFELVEMQGTRRDSLQVALAPVDDAPRLVVRPAADTPLREGVETILSWELAEVDGDGFTGHLLLGHDAAFSDTLLLAGLDPDQTGLTLAYRPEVGDSLRLGGRLHWRVSAADLPPGAGLLHVQEAIAITQSPQDLRLNLAAAPRQTAHHGDTLALAARIFSATGYVGGLVLRLEQDLQEVARADWPWTDLAAGEAMDTTLVLVMPLGGARSCWVLTLHPANPAEDPANNRLEECVELSREPVGVERAAFSPNGDGINDQLRFLFGAHPPARGFRVEIFEAGGRRVVAHDLAPGAQEWSWDGRSGGRELLPGAYAWILLDGERVLARGQLGVVR